MTGTHLMSNDETDECNLILIQVFYPFVTIAISIAFAKVGLENRTVHPKRIRRGDDGSFTYHLR